MVRKYQDVLGPVSWIGVRGQVADVLGGMDMGILAHIELHRAHVEM